MLHIRAKYGGPLVIQGGCCYLACRIDVALLLAAVVLAYTRALISDHGAGGNRPDDRRSPTLLCKANQVLVNFILPQSGERAPPDSCHKCCKS